MNRRSVILALAMFVAASAAVRAQSPEQRQADAQLASPKISPGAAVATLDLKATSLKDAVAAIAQASGITVRYHSAVTGVERVPAVKLSNATVEDALHAVLDARGLTFKVTGARSVFVYADTPANREQYSESVRTFSITKANVNSLGQVLNQALPSALKADDLRPVIVSMTEARTISVCATPAVMAKVATLIADNDK
jgi:hypothetical protein